MNININRGNSTVKIKSLVWKVKVGVYSPVLINQLIIKTESKPWKIKVILN